MRKDRYIRSLLWEAEQLELWVVFFREKKDEFYQLLYEISVLNEMSEEEFQNYIRKRQTNR